ncbi:hypothetical protein [Streptomyces sp. NPDC056600]|uniref:hypothetical protein n=1 Tax=Streptomyces sp. NPDC056600 TaxID=3345874 RepID=UPI0036815C1A
MHWYEVIQQQSAGTYFRTASHCSLGVTVLLSHHQRRPRRGVGEPGTPVRGADVLLPPAPPEGTRRVTGSVYLFAQSILMMGAFVSLIVGRWVLRG